MLYAVFDFGQLGVVEAIQGTYQVSGDSSDSFEFYAYSYQAFCVWFESSLHLLLLPAVCIFLVAAGGSFR